MEESFSSDDGVMMDEIVHGEDVNVIQEVPGMELPLWTQKAVDVDAAASVVVPEQSVVHHAVRPQPLDIQAELDSMRDKFGVTIPPFLAHSLLICLLSDSHLLLDVSRCATARIQKRRGSRCGSALLQALPIFVGLSCTRFVFTSKTTPREFLQHLIMREDEMKEKMDITGEKHETEAGTSEWMQQSAWDKGGTPRKPIPVVTAVKARLTRGRSLSLTGIQPSPSRIATLRSRVLPTGPPRGLEEPKTPPHVRVGGAKKQRDRIVREQVVVLEGLSSASPDVLETLTEVMAMKSVLYQGRSLPFPRLLLIVALIRDPGRDIIQEPPLELRDRFLLCASLQTPWIPKPLQMNQTLTQKIMSMRGDVSPVVAIHDVMQYMRDFVVEMRNADIVVEGPTARGMSGLALAARVEALLQGVSFVTPSHVVNVVVEALCHRVSLDIPDPFHIRALIEGMVEFLRPPV